MDSTPKTHRETSITDGSGQSPSDDAEQPATPRNTNRDVDIDDHVSPRQLPDQAESHRVAINISSSRRGDLNNGSPIKEYVRQPAMSVSQISVDVTDSPRAGNEDDSEAEYDRQRLRPEHYVQPRRQRRPLISIRGRRPCMIVRRLCFDDCDDENLNEETTSGNVMAVLASPDTSRRPILSTGPASLPTDQHVRKLQPDNDPSTDQNNESHLISTTNKPTSPRRVDIAFLRSLLNNIFRHSNCESWSAKYFSLDTDYDNADYVMDNISDDDSDIPNTSCEEDATDDNSEEECSGNNASETGYLICKPQPHVNASDLMTPIASPGANSDSGSSLRDIREEDSDAEYDRARLRPENCAAPRRQRRLPLSRRARLPRMSRRRLRFDSSDDENNHQEDMSESTRDTPVLPAAKRLRLMSSSSESPDPSQQVRRQQFGSDGSTSDSYLYVLGGTKNQPVRYNRVDTATIQDILSNLLRSPNSDNDLPGQTNHGNNPPIDTDSVHHTSSRVDSAINISSNRDDLNNDSPVKESVRQPAKSMSPVSVDVTDSPRVGNEDDSEAEYDRQRLRPEHYVQPRRQRRPLISIRERRPCMIVRRLCFDDCDDENLNEETTSGNVMAVQLSPDTSRRLLSSTGPASLPTDQHDRRLQLDNDPSTDQNNECHLISTTNQPTSPRRVDIAFLRSLLNYIFRHSNCDNSWSAKYFSLDTDYDNAECVIDNISDDDSDNANTSCEEDATDDNSDDECSGSNASEMGYLVCKPQPLLNASDLLTPPVSPGANSNSGSSLREIREEDSDAEYDRARLRPENCAAPRRQRRLPLSRRARLPRMSRRRLRFDSSDDENNHQEDIYESTRDTPVLPAAKRPRLLSASSESPDPSQHVRRQQFGNDGSTSDSYLYVLGGTKNQPVRYNRVDTATIQAILSNLLRSPNSDNDSPDQTNHGNTPPIDTDSVHHPSSHVDSARQSDNEANTPRDEQEASETPTRRRKPDTKTRSPQQKI